MSFVMGLIFGLCISVIALLLVLYCWLGDVIDPEHGSLLKSRTCPPCDGACQQGRNCPAGG